MTPSIQPYFIDTPTQFNLMQDFELTMEDRNYRKFFSMLTASLPIGKNETLDFLVQNRHELGKFVFKKSHVEAGEVSMGAYRLLTNQENSFYGFLKTTPSFGGLVEELRIYELRENPDDCSSPLIGFVRVVKNPLLVRKPNLSLEQLFTAFNEKLKRKTNLYEINYIEVMEKYCGRGFGYLLLHCAIYDTLTSDPKSSVKLHDQSGYVSGQIGLKAIKLYTHVGEYLDSEKRVQRDFNCKPSIDRDYYYNLST
ncbi:MAG: hypothetical protein L0207_02440 [Chlamydiae bacterium]|nr:hypothetical protein [Chlamydiota bacterium]